MHRVAVLLLPPVVGFDATIAPTLFSSATDADGNALYEVVTCGLTAGPVAATSGFDIVPSAGADALAVADTVVIPGTRYAPARIDGVLSAEVSAALALIRPGTRLVSICTGAFVLAAAGLLDGRPATTHWKFADAMRRMHPEVLVDENVLFVDDGDILTSAGLAAGIDLCLHIIRRDHGAQVANAVARYCVVPPWREGGQAQFIDRHVPTPDDHSTATTREWALGHLDDELTVQRLARHAKMSARTFNRRFREETGESPGAWIRSRRVDRARELLESRDLPIDEVARLSGLGTGGNLRHHLRRGMGMSPSSYRKVYQGPNPCRRRRALPTMARMAEPLIVSIRGRAPEMHAESWVAPNASLIGQVSLAARASVWYGATLRAEAEPIEIGFGTNIQDGVTIHVDPEFPVKIGAGVSVGHNAVLHGCEVEDDVLIGMGAVILNGARIGKGSLIAASALVLAGRRGAAAIARHRCAGRCSARTQRRRDRPQPLQRRVLPAIDRFAPHRDRLTVQVPFGRARVRTYGESNANTGHRGHRLCRLPARHRITVPGPRCRRHVAQRRSAGRLRLEW